MPKLGMEPIRKKQLVEAALQCIAKYGYKKTTVKMISQEANVSTGVLHHYFKNKDALIEETQRYLLTGLKTAYLEQVAHATTPKERLVAIIDATLSDQQMSSEGYDIWLTFWSECMHSEPLAHLETVSRARHHSNLVYTLKQFLDKEEAIKQAHIINALMDGLWLRKAILGKPDPLPIHDILYEYVDNLIAQS